MIKVSNNAIAVKKFIASSGAKIMAIDFIKTDGQPRTMVFNPRTAKGLVGDKASDSAKQAVATRKANNPNLINACDQMLLAKGDPAYKCWRSINCDTTSEIRVNGEVFTFEPEAV